MNPSIQGFVVFVIVAVALGYSAMKFMPKVWRLRVAGGASALALRLGVSHANARRVEAKLSTGGACGSCDSCKACATPESASVPLASDRKTIPIRSVR